MVGLNVQLRLSLGYDEDALTFILERDYTVKLSHHAVGNVFHRAGLAEPKVRKPRLQRRLNDYPYTPGGVGQLDVKHWRRDNYQYGLIDCAARIKYKRSYPGTNPAHTADYLEHAVQFFNPAFGFRTIHTGNDMAFVYDQLPQTKPDTLTAMQR